MSRQILPIWSALPIQDVKIHTYNKAQQYWRKEHVCANILVQPKFISWIGKAAPIFGLFGGSPHVTYSKSLLVAPLYWRCKSYIRTTKRDPFFLRCAFKLKISSHKPVNGFHTDEYVDWSCQPLFLTTEHVQLDRKYCRDKNYIYCCVHNVQ
jgi:hypothetical protein